jgi:methyl acetate hydrolase
VARSPAGTLTNSNTFTEPMKSATKDIGGGGMYSTAGDYMKLLKALLQNDGTLLSKSSVSELLKPQVEDNAYLDHERNAYIFSNIWPNGAKANCNHGLGGLVNMEDLSTGRKTGSMMWLGATAIVWVS